MKNYVLFTLLFTFTSSFFAHKITLLPKNCQRIAFNRPASFGKTHFIRGYQQNNQQNAQLSAIKEKNKLATQDQQCDVFFTPDDDINKKLISLIDQEQSYIRIAVFNFTNRTIAQALIDAAKRGVKVEVITDITCIFDRYNKIDQLYDNDIAVLIFDAKKNKTRGIMHHKFALFSNNKGGTTYVWTGSCNFTRSGCQINQENGLLLADQTIINKFLQQFERIKKQTYGYKPFIQK